MTEPSFITAHLLLPVGTQVVLRSGSRVQGDVRAPRVALEEGAWFRGTVDMDGGALGS